MMPVRPAPLERQHDWCCYEAAMPIHLRISLIGAGSAFGAAGAVLALMGVGAPFVLAASIASAGVGVILYMAAPRLDSTTPGQIVAANARAEAIEKQAAGLRHDLRGALSPALIMSDRLLESTDPAVRRTGEAVIRSIERAAALLAAAKPAPDPPAELQPQEKKNAA